MRNKLETSGKMELENEKFDITQDSLREKKNKML